MLKKHNFSSQDVIYLKGDINYTEFFMSDGRRFTSSTTLKRHQADERLKDFLRVNKSYLVNRKFINECRTNYNSVMIFLSNGDEIKVSRRRQKVIKKTLTISTEINPENFK